MLTVETISLSALVLNEKGAKNTGAPLVFPK